MLLVLVTPMSFLVYRHKKNPREGTQAYARYARPSAFEWNTEFEEPIGLC
jgi:hypothetical protein